MTVGGALRMTDKAADARDLLQDMTIKADVGFGSFREGTNLKAWPYRVMTNAYGYRERQRQLLAYPTQVVPGQEMNHRQGLAWPGVPGLRVAVVKRFSNSSRKV